MRKIPVLVFDYRFHTTKKKRIIGIIYRIHQRTYTTNISFEKPDIYMYIYICE